MPEQYKGDLSKLVPFEPRKNAEQLGIDTKRKFVVVREDNFPARTILTLVRDNGFSFPVFMGNGLKPSVCNWSCLAYLPEDEAKAKTKSLLRPAVRKVLEQEIEYMEREAERLERNAARAKELRAKAEGLRAVI
ncbi:MAG: hypothetical protein M0R06_25050 [Sphaerochaeta sp.]|jgi:hypothetical protein|nr:hypothetical protein [Sphaerochaeta sp.]